jgi:hypothetical protein
MQARAGEMDSSAISAIATFKSMDPIEPNPISICAKRIGIWQGGRVAASIPFLAVYRTGMTANTDIKVYD